MSPVLIHPCFTVLRYVVPWWYKKLNYTVCIEFVNEMLRLNISNLVVSDGRLSIMFNADRSEECQFQGLQIYVKPYI